LELRTRRVSLTEVVQSAVEATRPLIDEAGHEFTLTLPGENVELQADPNRLAQVFSNLLNNACKYTPRGGKIALIAERSEGAVEVTVRDNGLGIPRDMQREVFEMFAQIDRPLERADKGLGIGLTLVKQLVEMHGGTVAVQSDGAGLGSAFSVRLPISIAPAKAEPSSAARSEAASPTPKLRVLVVDDNNDGVTMMGIVVRTLGHEVRTAGDGVEAIAAAAEFRPHVVLMDLGMPRMTGYEAAQHIRGQAWGKSMLLVALTGWGLDEDKQRTKDAGFDQHLVKPADPATLRKLLSEVRPSSE
jgi:CheY-like chemotaxis protein/anti-sigma regulatory factor (Ser/Thr protein kinase)